MSRRKFTDYADEKPTFGHIVGEYAAAISSEFAIEIEIDQSLEKRVGDDYTFSASALMLDLEKYVREKLIERLSDKIGLKANVWVMQNSFNEVVCELVSMLNDEAKRSEAAPVRIDEVTKRLADCFANVEAGLEQMQMAKQSSSRTR